MLCCHAYAFEVERVPNLCSEYRKPIRHLVIDEWAEPPSKQTNLLTIANYIVFLRFIVTYLYSCERYITYIGGKRLK